MIITPDFTEAAEGFTTIAPGIYKARIAEVEQKTSQAGNDMLNWKLQIFGASGDLAKANNRAVFYRTMLTGKGAGMLRDLIKAAGEEPTPQFDTDVLLGKEVEITVVDGVDFRTGQPSGYPDVKRVKALTT